VTREKDERRSDEQRSCVKTLRADCSVALRRAQGDIRIFVCRAPLDDLAPTSFALRLAQGDIGILNGERRS